MLAGDFHIILNGQRLDNWLFLQGLLFFQKSENHECEITEVEHKITFDTILI